MADSIMTASLDAVRTDARGPRLLLMFDVEGTLVDCVPETLSCWRRTFRQFGFEFSMRDLQRNSGQDPDDMIKAMLPRRDVERLCAALKKEQGKRYREECLPKVQAHPGVRALFETIKDAGQDTALVTSCAQDELSRYLELTDIADLVGTIACGEDVDRAKPHPELIEIALRRAHNIAENTFMIGDTPFDAAAAIAAGITPVGLMCGGFTKEDLVAAGCRAVCRDPTELRQVFLHGLSQASSLQP